jgi:hypothetical protein
METSGNPVIELTVYSVTGYEVKFPGSQFISSVNTLGENSPFGRNFLALGAFFLENTAQN